MARKNNDLQARLNGKISKWLTQGSSAWCCAKCSHRLLLDITGTAGYRLVVLRINAAATRLGTLPRLRAESEDFRKNVHPSFLAFSSAGTGAQ
jgi:hypothetical protein